MTFNNDKSPAGRRAQHTELSTENEVMEEIEDEPLELEGPKENGRTHSLKLSGKLKIYCIHFMDIHSKPIYLL